MKKSSS